MPRIDIPLNFKRVLRKKEQKLQDAVIECIRRLGENPRHPSLQTHRVQGAQGVFEAYVDKANRVTFEWDGPKIVLRNNCNHDIVNKRP